MSDRIRRKIRILLAASEAVPFVKTGGLGDVAGSLPRALKEAGAKEVHVRISSPAFRYPCYFGIDVPARDQLIAYQRSEEDIRELLGADSLAYLKLDRLSQLVDGLSICRGCFTGTYPVDPPKEDIRGKFDA
mgnify:CR=1 FL=1